MPDISVRQAEHFSGATLKLTYKYNEKQKRNGYKI